MKTRMNIVHHTHIIISANNYPAHGSGSGSYSWFPRSFTLFSLSRPKSIFYFHLAANSGLILFILILFIGWTLFNWTVILNILSVNYVHFQLILSGNTIPFNNHFSLLSPKCLHKYKRANDPPLVRTLISRNEFIKQQKALVMSLK